MMYSISRDFGPPKNMPKWRPRIDTGRRLFRTGDAAAFEAALALHARVCAKIARDDGAARAAKQQQKKKKKTAGDDRLRYTWGDIGVVRRDLPKNDEWMRTGLPQLLKARGRLRKEDMRRLLAWKWAYGKYRPGKTRFEDANRDDSVGAATANAVSVMETGLESLAGGEGKKGKNADTDTDALISSAAAALITMPQVGPATATAVLSAGYPSLCPFYADEAMESTGMFREPYTLKRYLAFAKLLRTKAEALGTDHLDANSISRALWAVSKASALGMDVGCCSSTATDSSSSSGIRGRAAGGASASSASAARPSKRRKMSAAAAAANTKQ